MENIEFKKIHDSIINFLQEEDSSELEVIGSWYFRFLQSDKEKFSLHLPYYFKEFTSLAFNYLRTFTLIYNLSQEKKLTDFKNTCLFDVFNTAPDAIMDDLTLDFSKQNQNIAFWGLDTITKLDAFLPIFNKEDIVQFNKPKTIKNTFELFKSIRNLKVFDIPLLIELNEKILSFNNLENIKNNLISEKLFSIESTPDDDYASELEEEMIAQELNNSLFIKYPYSKKPHPYLIDIAKNKFNLVFNTRFAYHDILESDVFILKDETNIGSKLMYSIVDTNHSKVLYDLFASFKEQWISLELNKFTTPFPKYWFLFLNPSLTKEEWLEQFKKDFPAVAELSIINIIELIIEEAIGLNWIEKIITSSTKILFPELKSNRKKRLEFVYNNFKNHVNSINTDIEFIENIATSNNYKNVVVLDSFNIIDLANINQCNYADKINVIVPDFLYYGYQPWIKYHLFDYQFSPLYNGLREALDENYNSNKEKIEKLKVEIIREIKSDLKKYKSRYTEEIEETVEAETNLEDLEYTNVEEIENTKLSIDRKTHLIIINENFKNELKLSSAEKVLSRKDSIFYVKATTLEIGDFIIRNSDISELYKSDNLFNKLVKIPEDILKYQNLLFRKVNIYQILKNKGISYQHENYFNNNYVLEKFDKNTFRIPRRKKDWGIICDYLNINYSDQQLSFIAYYGRSRQNELILIYKSIIKLLLQNNWIGAIGNPAIVRSVSDIVIQYNTIFQSTDKDEILEISESIISTILNQLTFTEIQTINIIKNE